MLDLYIKVNKEKENKEHNIKNIYVCSKYVYSN